MTGGAGHAGASQAGIEAGVGGTNERGEQTRSTVGPGGQQGIFEGGEWSIRVGGGERGQALGEGEQGFAERAGSAAMAVVSEASMGAAGATVGPGGTDEAPAGTLEAGRCVMDMWPS
ncbi:MAG: hypothetical protein U0821_10340 [Chloroflexota bacterium]